MAKINKEIIDIYDDYRSNLDCEKHVEKDFRISEHKKNHPESFFGSIDVNCDVEFGNTSLSCEIRNGEDYNYSITYLSDRLGTKVMSRLDVGNGTHRNVAPDIPLALSSVPTPHYHEYREDGRMLAYPLEGIDYSSKESVEFGLEEGYAYLCGKLHITSVKGTDPRIEFSEDGAFTWLDEETDPNENVVFPLTD